jgi:hypothetical protein
MIGGRNMIRNQFPKGHAPARIYSATASRPDPIALECPSNPAFAKGAFRDRLAKTGFGICKNSVDKSANHCLIERRRMMPL